MTLPIGVFYTVGTAMLLGRKEEEQAVPSIGSTLALPARSYHEREHCPKPCRHGEAQRQYRVVAIKVFNKTDGDTFDQVLSDRVWEQSICTEHRNCDDFFDWYALASYLTTHNSSPAVVLLVDVEAL
jgi:hypothetical protein